MPRWSQSNSIQHKSLWSSFGNVNNFNQVLDSALESEFPTFIKVNRVIFSPVSERYLPAFLRLQDMVTRMVRMDITVQLGAKAREFSFVKNSDLLCIKVWPERKQKPNTMLLWRLRTNPYVKFTRLLVNLLV